MRSRRSRSWSGCSRSRPQIIRQARVEAEAIITQSRSTPSGCARRCGRRRGPRPTRIVKNAERQIQLETGRALQQIRREAVDLSVMIASKIIQRNLTKEDNERLIDEALKQVEGAPPLELVPSSA